MHWEESMVTAGMASVSFISLVLSHFHLSLILVSVAVKINEGLSNLILVQGIGLIQIVCQIQ